MGIRVFLALLLLLWSALAPAETQRVGIKSVPPFAMPDGQGGWTGISVELWQRIAVGLGWKTTWVAMDSSRTRSRNGFQCPVLFDASRYRHSGTIWQLAGCAEGTVIASVSEHSGSAAAVIASSGSAVMAGRA